MLIHSDIFCYILLYFVYFVYFATWISAPLATAVMSQQVVVLSSQADLSHRRSNEFMSLQLLSNHHSATIDSYSLINIDLSIFSNMH